MQPVIIDFITPIYTTKKDLNDVYELIKFNLSTSFDNYTLYNMDDIIKTIYEYLNVHFWLSLEHIPEEYQNQQLILLTPLTILNDLLDNNKNNLYELFMSNLLTEEEINELNSKIVYDEIQNDNSYEIYLNVEKTFQELNCLIVGYGIKIDQKKYFITNCVNALDMENIIICWNGKYANFTNDRSNIANSKFNLNIDMHF